MKAIKIVCATTVALGMSVLLGCASKSNLEEHFGEAKASVNQAQIANPDAGQHDDDGVVDAVS